MKKILLGLVAAFALSTFAAPAFAEEPPAAGGAEGAKAEKSTKKKGKKAKKEEGAAGEAGSAAPPAEKPAK